MIDAAGAQAGDGRWPRVRVTIGGVSYGAIAVDKPRNTRYWVNFATEPGTSDVHLALLNGSRGPQGPHLTIAKLEFVPL